MDILNSISTWLSGAAMSPILISIAAVVEVVLRLIPSTSPQSILLLISGILKSVGGIFASAAGILDKVIPQNLK